MKRLISLIATLTAMSATAVAQQEYLFREHFDEKVDKIEIHSGWPVKLVSRIDDSIFVCIVSSDPTVAETLQSSQAFAYDDKTLTLRRPIVRLRGCSVEIHANFLKKQLVLKPGATVSADSLTISQSVRDIQLNEGSTLAVGRLHCKRLISVDIHDASLLVDTLSGSQLSVYVYGNGQLSVNHYEQEKLIVSLQRGHGTNCYSFPDPNVVVEKHIPYKCYEDTIRHIAMEDYDEIKWNNSLSLYGKSGVKFHTTPAGWNKETGWLTNITGAPISSPYASVMDFELNVPLQTQFQLNSHCFLTTGLDFRWVFTPMNHKVKVDDNGLLQLADGADHFANLSISSYMGIPVSLIWTPAKTRWIDLSVDLFAGFNCENRMWEFGSESSGNILHSTSSKTSYLNPFKLEMGFSIQQRMISGVTMLRFYANLLPDYRNLPELPKCHTLGLEIRF